MAKTVDILGFPHVYELTPARKRSCVLVFVHGWLLSREYWRPLIDLLSEDYQCLIYDLRGFGESRLREPIEPNGSSIGQARSPSSACNQRETSDSASATALAGASKAAIAQSIANGNATATLKTRGYTPADYAQDLVQLLEALDIECAWLIGHSLGGSVALWASDQSPQRIQGVSCLNSGGGIYLKEEFEKFRTAGQQLIKLRRRWLCYLPFIDLMMNRMNVASPVDRKWGRQRVVDLVTADAAAALGSLLESTTEEEVHKLPHVVSRLKQPVYFIGGAKDDIMEPQYVNHLASFHASFEVMGDNVIQIPDCGHLAMVERPDQVALHLRHLLAKHGFDA